MPVRTWRKKDCLVCEEEGWDYVNAWVIGSTYPIPGRIYRQVASRSDYKPGNVVVEEITTGNRVHIVPGFVFNSTYEWTT